MEETIIKNKVEINLNFYKSLIKTDLEKDCNDFIKKWKVKFPFNATYPKIKTSKGYFKQRPTFEIKYFDIHIFTGKKRDDEKTAKEWLLSALYNTYCATYHQYGEVVPEAFILGFLNIYFNILKNRTTVIIKKYEDKQEFLNTALEFFKLLSKSNITKNEETCLKITNDFCKKFKISNSEYILNKDNVLVRSYDDDMKGNKLRSYFETKMYCELIVDIINKNRNRILCLEDAVKILREYEDIEFCKIYTKSKKYDGVHPFLNIDVRKLESMLVCDKKLSKIKKRQDIEKDIALNRWLLDGSSPEKIKEIEKLSLSVRTIYNIINDWKSANKTLGNCSLK